MKIFCHLHETTFRLIRGQQVVCDVGLESFAEAFPNDDWWCFCCGCQTFWKFNDATIQEPMTFACCIVCGRRVLKNDTAKQEPRLTFYLCHSCKTVSFQTKDVAKGAAYTLQPSVLARFRCPGCDAAIHPEACQHECKVLGAPLMTSRQECPLCGDGFRQHNQKAVVPKSNTALKQPELNAANRSTPIVKEIRLPSQSQRTDQTRSSVPSSTSESPASSQAKQQKESRGGRQQSSQRHLVENKPAAQVAKPGILRWRGLVGGSIAGTAFIVVSLFILFFNSKGQTTSEKASVPGEAPTVGVGASQPPTGMIFVAGNEFWMGSDDGDEFERPQHKVQVNSFFLDKYEVSCEEYDRFVRATGHRLPPLWTSNQYPPNGAHLPVTGVDWDDANAYCQWAGKRLPTEAEWEYAARGTDKRRYPWGNDWRENAANADQSSQKKLVNVGSFVAGASPFGALDLIGNAWEWTADQIKAYPDGRLPEIFGEEYKVIRGGSWNEDRKQGASATYRGYLPARGSKDYSLTGCRCVKNVN